MLTILFRPSSIDLEPTIQNDKDREAEVLRRYLLTRLLHIKSIFEFTYPAMLYRIVSTDINWEYMCLQGSREIIRTYIRENIILVLKPLHGIILSGEPNEKLVKGRP